MAKNPDNQPLGSHLGRAVSEHLADMIVSIRSRMAPIEQSHRIDVNNAWMEDAERRLQPIVRAMLKDIPDGTEMPEWLAMLKATSDAPANQTDFFLYLIAIIGMAIVGVPALGAVALQPTLNKAWAGAPTRPLSPADLADMVERGIRDPVAAGGVAAQSGMDPLDFADLVLDTGEPPGILEMVALWRRGALSESELNRMIAYSRIRTEWTPQVKAAGQETMSGADAIGAAVKGVIPTGDAATLFAQSGGIPDQFDTLLNVAGDAIGVQQANSLYLHHLISHDDLQAVILHSMINPRFEPMAELLRFHYLSVYQIANALSSGACTPEQATTWLTQEGYPADQIAAFVGAESAPKTVKHKELSESQSLKLFEADEITRAQLAALLANLGYTEDEMGAVIQTYEAQKIITAQNQAVTAIRKAFLAGRREQQEVMGDLDSLGVTALARDHYIADWTVEKGTQYKALTEAQIAAAAKKGFITYADAVGRWVAMGYTVADAGILAELAGYTPGAP